VTTLTRPRAGTRNGGVPARRAVFRWSWRLFRHEWRQQLWRCSRRWSAPTRLGCCPLSTNGRRHAGRYEARLDSTTLAVNPLRVGRLQGGRPRSARRSRRSSSSRSAPDASCTKLSRSTSTRSSPQPSHPKPISSATCIKRSTDAKAVGTAGKPIAEASGSLSGQGVARSDPPQRFLRALFNLDGALVQLDRQLAPNWPAPKAGRIPPWDSWPPLISDSRFAAHPRKQGNRNDDPR
jgi:hypothetical protein